MFNRNILAVKEAQLNALVAESGGAVSLITSTIDRLETINSKITDTRQEIATYQSELNRIDGSMEQQFGHNAKIIGKFKSFLED